MREASNTLRVEEVSVSITQNASRADELQDGNIPFHLSVVMNEVASEHDTYTLPPVESSLHVHPLKLVFVTVSDAESLNALTYTPPPRPPLAVQSLNV